MLLCPLMYWTPTGILGNSYSGDYSAHSAEEDTEHLKNKEHAQLSPVTHMSTPQLPTKPLISSLFPQQEAYNKP